ncbi:MAG TPA: hypothetical protein VGG75_13965 [Trebonia sp.]|jgi:hypothetical protein
MTTGGRPCAPKIRFNDELGARIALLRTGSRKQRRKRNETRVYRCELCRGWHLTSQPKRGKT